MKPILFSLGPFHVFSYGTLIAVGVILAVRLMIRLEAREKKFSQPYIYDLVFIALFSGFAGSRIFYVIENFSYYSQNPARIFAFWEGGLIYYGGVILTFVVLFFFARYKKTDFLSLLDFLLPFLALVHAFGRIGCFLNGCCYGKACALPWGVTFPGLEFPVHPTQLYEALFNFGLFLFLYFLYPRRPFPGFVAGLYFLLYGVGRFVIEFWRVHYSSWLSLSWNQWISVGLILLGLFLVLRGRFRRRQN